MALPYPVGITSVANFSASEGAYSPPVRRRIAALFNGRSKTRLRKRLHDLFEEGGGYVDNYLSYICTPGHLAKDYCEVVGNSSNVYVQAVNSEFCLEPSGDTPTRSHLYLAVLCGCIPVIFDYDIGHGNTGYRVRVRV